MLRFLIVIYINCVNFFSFFKLYYFFNIFFLNDLIFLKKYIIIFIRIQWTNEVINTSLWQFISAIWLQPVAPTNHFACKVETNDNEFMTFQIGSQKEK